MTDRLITIQELSDRLQIKPSFIRKLVFQRRLPVIRVGRCLRFKPTAIEAWLAERSTPARDDK